MKFVLTFGMGAMAVKGVQAIERGYAITWVYPALGCVSILLVITIGVLIVRMRSGVKQPDGRDSQGTPKDQRPRRRNPISSAGHTTMNPTGN
jgi:hypothetical protein